MTNHPHHPASSPRPFLVAVGGNQVLVDAARERLLVLDEAGARAWRELEAGQPPRTREQARFAAELAALGLRARPEPADLPEAPAGDAPRILAQVPLQVAAGTSDPSPFSSDPLW
jgi:hypothetical protein